MPLTNNNSELSRCIDFKSMQQAVSRSVSVQTFGKVAQANGTLLKVTGLSASIGELCHLQNPGSDWHLEAEVVGLTEQYTVLTPLGSLQGVCNSTQVVATGLVPQIEIGKALLGKVLDAKGLPLAGERLGKCDRRYPLYTDPPNPMQRQSIDRVLTTGIKTIDSLLTVGEGQRMGIFAVAGAGKSTLLSMLARGSDADINVIALVGERGREVSEFVYDNLQNSLQKSVVIAATSDRPALERARAVYSATAIAEYFRDQGKKVLLLVDSMTRYARALRDVGLAAGEPPTRRGFPPSVFSVLPQIMERAGTSDKGSITAFYTVLMEDEDIADPIAEEVRSILDGHIHLSRKLAGKNHYPAIDVLGSASRLMDKLVSEQHIAHASRLRQLLAKYQEIELLVQMGEYKEGHDKEADAALHHITAIEQHLIQKNDQFVSFDESLNSLQQFSQS